MTLFRMQDIWTIEGRADQETMSPRDSLIIPYRNKLTYLPIPHVKELCSYARHCA